MFNMEASLKTTPRSLGFSIDPSALSRTLRRVNPSRTTTSTPSQRRESEVASAMGNMGVASSSTQSKLDEMVSNILAKRSDSRSGSGSSMPWPAERTHNGRSLTWYSESSSESLPASQSEIDRKSTSLKSSPLG